MRRTQISITAQQDVRIADLARDQGISKAEVICRILGTALDSGAEEQEGWSVIRETSGICAGYPDWPEWLASVRGQEAHES